MNQIRRNIGYSQKYVSNEALTQGAFSKFEKLNTDIRLTAFEGILLKLEMSYDEFYFIRNGYDYSYRQKLLNKLFGLTYNHMELLQLLLEEANIYLKNHDDILIKDITHVCKSLIIFRQTNDIEKARIPLLKVWERLAKRNVLYINDIYFINTILFLFPLETALEIKKFTFRSIDRYKNLNNIERLKINIYINLALLLIKEKNFTAALSETELAIELCQKYSDYLRLAICYIRKGICLNHLNNNDNSSVWIEKGRNILIAIEESQILKVLDDEINRHNFK